MFFYCQMPSLIHRATPRRFCIVKGPGPPKYTALDVYSLSNVFLNPMAQSETPSYCQSLRQPKDTVIGVLLLSKGLLQHSVSTVFILSKETVLAVLISSKVSSLQGHSLTCGILSNVVSSEKCLFSKLPVFILTRKTGCSHAEKTNKTHGGTSIRTEMVGIYLDKKIFPSKNLHRFLKSGN